MQCLRFLLVVRRKVHQAMTAISERSHMRVGPQVTVRMVGLACTVLGLVFGDLALRVGRLTLGETVGDAGRVVSPGAFPILDDSYWRDFALGFGFLALGSAAAAYLATLARRLENRATWRAMLVPLGTALLSASFLLAVFRPTMPWDWLALVAGAACYLPTLLTRTGQETRARRQPT